MCGLGQAAQGEQSVVKIQVMSRYKFGLAFENTRDPDYMTEKVAQLWLASCIAPVSSNCSAQSQELTRSAHTSYIRCLRCWRQVRYLCTLARRIGASFCPGKAPPSSMQVLLSGPIQFDTSSSARTCQLGHP